MHDRQSLVDLGKEFRQIVANPQSKTTEILDFVTAHPEFVVNSADPITGFTALHVASNQNAYDTLFSLGCNPELKDKAGFTAFEYFHNSYQYQPIFAENHCLLQVRYHQFFLHKYNEKLPAETILLYVDRLEEINRFIDQHPAHAKIGFIVKKPNILRSLGKFDDRVVRDLHYSAIYYERHKTQEIFIQIDSALGSLYTLPAANQKTWQRIQYYFPLNRQRHGSGCFEDAIVLLASLITQTHSDLRKFCENNASKELALIKNITKPEKIHYKNLYHKHMRGLLEAQEQIDYPPLRRKVEHEKLLRLYKHKQLSSVKHIMQLTTLPPMLYMHVDFYPTMRFLKLKNPKTFQAKSEPANAAAPTILSLLWQKGATRVKDLPLQQIKNNLSNPNPMYDFKGRDFAEREKLFEDYYYAYDQMTYVFFRSKVASIEPEKSAKLARYITSFVTGLEEDDLPLPASGYNKCVS